MNASSSDNSAHAEKIRKLALAVIDTEAKAVSALAPRIDAQFVRACDIALACRGRIVVMGMGKSGHIGGKIAATLASTGSPAFFVHPGEASHGDLGMLTEHDVVLAISNSGETDELRTILPIIKRLGVPLIALTGKPGSTLASNADAHLDVSVAQEACPLGLAPTASTTATLAMGDALAVALLEVRGFTSEDFARSHPAGALGRKLLLLIDDIMHTDDGIPKVTANTTFLEALDEMSKKGLGMTLVVDDTGYLLGIYTDGDLRRTLGQGPAPHELLISAVMTRNCTTIRRGVLAAEALQIMQAKKINAVPVVDEQHRPVGVFNMHDLLRAGVV